MLMPVVMPVGIRGSPSTIDSLAYVCADENREEKVSQATDDARSSRILCNCSRLPEASIGRDQQREASGTTRDASKRNRHLIVTFRNDLLVTSGKVGCNAMALVLGHNAAHCRKWQWRSDDRQNGCSYSRAKSLAKW